MYGRELPRGWCEIVIGGNSLFERKRDRAIVMGNTERGYSGRVVVNGNTIVHLTGVPGDHPPAPTPEAAMTFLDSLDGFPDLSSPGDESPPGPVPTPDPEQEIADALRQDATSMLRRFADVLSSTKLPTARTLRLAEKYIDSMRSVVGELGIPEEEDNRSPRGRRAPYRNLVQGNLVQAFEDEGVGETYAMPQVGVGGRRRRRRDLADGLPPGLQADFGHLAGAQRLQALMTSLREAEAMHDAALVARLRREIDAILVPEEGEDVDEAIVDAAVEGALAARPPAAP